MEDHLYFNGWDKIERVLIVGVFSYFALIILLRASGKRTLSRMSAYDLVITMALGSIMANVLLTNNISIAESITATALLIFLQFVLSFIAVRVPWIKHMLTPQPSVLYHNGHYIEKAMKRERVCKTEVICALNEEGLSHLSEVKSVILEANGELCVIAKQKPDSHKTRQTKID